LFSERQAKMEGSYNDTIVALGKLIAGLQKYPPQGGVTMISGKSYTTAEVVAQLQSIINALSAVVAARQTFQGAVKASETIVEDNSEFVRDFKQSVKAQLGQNPPALGEFGLTPRKLSVRTPDVSVAAAAKAKATRTARGTKGSKQKASIKGNVTSVTITANTSSEAPAPASPPATPAATTPVVAAAGSSTVVSSH
jgi:hypothetical protein